MLGLRLAPRTLKLANTRCLGRLSSPHLILRPLNNPLISIAFLGLRHAQSRAGRTLQQPAPVSADGAKSPTSAKIDKKSQDSNKEHPILKRTPKFLHRYFGRVLTAPGSHIVAFLILHEITAIVPLFALWYAFHHYGFIPTGIPDWILGKGIDFVNVLAEKYNWGLMAKAADSSRILMEGAAAYSIVKITLPLRAAFSIMLMPWFARIFVLPITGLFKRKKVASPKN